MSDQANEGRPRPRRIGRVTSDKMDKTIAVRVERLVKHPLYQKYVRRHTMVKAHDEQNLAKVGDEVELEFAAPISKTKRWRLLRVVKQSARV